MTEDELRLGYARAFLAQARSDWDVYKVLADQPMAPCHALHYLQMASEKLAKAYRLRDTAADLKELTHKQRGSREPHYVT